MSSPSASSDDDDDDDVEMEDYVSEDSQKRRTKEKLNKKDAVRTRPSLRHMRLTNLKANQSL